MQYCINALLKNNNEIMQYYIINNDIALIMHYCALLQMPDYVIGALKTIKFQLLAKMMSNLLNSYHTAHRQTYCL